MKTKLTIFCLWLCVALPATAQHHVLHKVVQENDAITFVETNNSVTYAIGDIRKMTYEGNILYVYLKDNTIYSADVASLSISNNSDNTTQDKVIDSINALETRIFPNPATDRLQVEYSLPANDNVQIIVYNMSGQRVKLLYNSWQIAGINSNVFDISNLSNGTHLLQIKGDRFSITKTFIKQ